MKTSIIVEEEVFFITDCGGSGACLFKCLAKSVSKVDHRVTRRRIINYIIDNWETYHHWVEYIFGIKTKEQYRHLMSSVDVYGSELECRAASQLYGVNIVIIRKLNHKYFRQEYGTDNNENKCIYLLFTGMKNEGDRDGHYQLLEKNIISDANERSESEQLDKVINESPTIELNRKLQDITNTQGLPIKSREVTPHISNKSENAPPATNVAKRRFFPKIFKEAIINVKDFFEKEVEGKSENYITELTARCLKISESSVKRICYEYKKLGFVQDLQLKNNGRIKSIELDSFYQGLIRNTIFDMYMEKTFPTIKKIHRKLIEKDPDFPKMSDKTLCQELKKLNFRYKKIQRKPILMENKTIAGKRAEYLYHINEFRNKKWNIFYTDETWCGANHTKQYCWVEKIENISCDSYDHYRSGVQLIGGYRGGFVTPSGAGKRVIILHIGSENGFLKGAMKCFIGKKGSSDYHDEMNAMHYEEWFREILTLLPANSVIVIDQAPYHTMLHPNFRNPTAAWNKADIVNWMIRRNIPLPRRVENFEKLYKMHLLVLCKPYHFEKVYLLDYIAKNMREDVKLLWLPVAHCEFNPIELVWAYVKNEVAKRNQSFKVKDVHTLCVETMNKVPDTLWRNCVQHVLKIEEKFRHTQSRLAEQINPIIIYTADDTDDDLTESSDECNDEE